MYCLEKVGEFFHDNDLLYKSQNIKEQIIKLAYNGELFVDNLIRNDNNELIKTNNYSEVCQYYAFWFNLIQINDYPNLYNELINNLGFNKNTEYKNLSPSNLFFGLYLRIDLLMRENKRKEILNECRKLFSHMAESTGTLWEHIDNRAACCQAFPSYSIRWIIFALTGYDVLTNKFTSNEGIGIDCAFKIPIDHNKFINLAIKNNVLQVN